MTLSKDKNLQRSIDKMVESINDILQDDVKAIYLYGSIVLDDFKLGWSDIDLLVLTKNQIDNEKAEKLLKLRQELLQKEPKNKYYRSFEGAMLSLDGFLNQAKETVVYWGTKGEKIKENYALDSFSKKELIESSLLVYGEDVKDLFEMPSKEELYQDIERHYQTIREHAQKTGRNLYSFGWFLDISRCLYTLKTGKIISKTKAGEWALKNNLCVDDKVLKRVLRIRKNPLRFKKKAKVMDWAETLGKAVQRYADVLEVSLKENKKE